MKSLARCAVLLCLWASATAQDDIKFTLDVINNEIIRGTYSARVQVTRTEKESISTYTILEYHDSTTGIHSVNITSSNTQKFFYRNLGAGTVVTVGSDAKCVVADIGDAAKEPDAFIYQSIHATEPEYFFGPTAAVIEMSTDDTTWSSAPDEIRGIKTTVYSNLERDDANPKAIDIWFADNWNIRRMSEKNIPFPIRVVILEKGISHKFDYYQVEDLSPKEAFRLSNNLVLPFRTVGCKLPKPKVQPASLLSTFSFTSAVDGEIAAKEYFSIEDKLYRADSEGSTVIHDDKHGLIYTLGNRCDVRPNEYVNPAILSMGSDNFGANIVQAYLSLPTKVYIGEGFVRGVPVDIWEALPEESDPNVKRARFFFSKSDSVQSANGNEGSQQLMKAMLLNSLEHDDTLDVDIYDFSASLGDLDFRKHFNIEDCVEASMYVEFVFEAEPNVTLDVEEFILSNAMKELIEALEDNIELSTGVSFLQLPSFKGEISNGNRVTVIAKILAPPPYVKSFTVRPDMFGHYDGSPMDGNEETCAKECIEKKCPTFLLCGGSKCQLQKSADETKWGQPDARFGKDCQAYDHVNATEMVKRKTLEEISTTLEESVMMLWSAFNVSMSDRQIVRLRAAEFTDHLTQFNQQGRLGPYTLQLTGSAIKDDHESSVVVNGEVPTIGQCYRECRTNKDIGCSSFSICTGTKHCVLTSENINAGTSNDIDQANTIRIATQDCTVYSVNYLSEFERLNGKSFSIGSIENKAGKTAGDCAVRCRQQRLDVLEECRSFDFCPKDGMCLFYRTHYDWDGGNETLVKGDCDHYALRYSASYTAIGKGAFVGKPATTVKSVSLEECAKQCSERSNGDCKTISYCNQPKETCYLYAADILDLSDANDKENSCTIYTQLVSYNDDLINPKRQIEKERMTIVLGMGEGAFAFLLIAMLAVGAVLGAAGWFQREKVLTLIGRSGGSSGSGTTISYNRQDDENRSEA